MRYRYISSLCLFAVALICSASFAVSETYAQSVLSCVGGDMTSNNSTRIDNTSSTTSPKNSNMFNNFNDWKIISGDWNQSSSNLEGGTGINTSLSVENIIINPNSLENLSEINTTFRANGTDPNLSSYAYIVYSYIDPDNFKIAGVHIENGDIFVRFAEIEDGCLTAKPSYIYTGTKWQPYSTFNLKLASDEGIQSLLLNDTQFAGKNDTNIDGVTGLFYGRLGHIEFYNFTVTYPFVNSDSNFVFLGDKSIPENDYIPIYDSTPYEITEGHISAKFPCDEDLNTDVTVLAGKIGQFREVTLQPIEELSEPDDVCHYDSDIKSSKGYQITDIALLNNSTDEIEFPTTSSIIVSVTKMTK